MARTIRVVSGVNEGVSFDIEEGQALKVGRTGANDIVLPYDSCISGKHAMLKVERGVVKVSDLASTNGTFLDGRKLPHGEFFAVDRFLVIGSTIIFVTDHSEHCEHHPVVPDPAHHAWANLPILQAALANNGDQPFIHSGHLFLALLAVYPNEIQEALAKFGLDPDANQLKQRLVRHKVFQGDHAWLNRSLTLRAKLPKESHTFVTPRVQALLEAPEFKAVDLLCNILTNDFNLAFPLLAWDGQVERWRKVAAQIRRPAQAAQRKAATPASLSEAAYGLAEMQGFWDRIERAFTLNELLVITGTRGCGKTTALHLAYQQRDTPFLSSAFYQGERTFLDPKAFMFFNPPGKLSSYAFRAAETLIRGGLMVIDHFDEMLLAMEQANLDRSQLIQALRKHSGPTILCAPRENMELIDTHLGAVNLLDMDQHLTPILPIVHENLLKGFEKRIQGVLGPKAKRFYEDQVVGVNPCNIVAIKEFLTMSAERVKAIDPMFSELGEETRASGLLGEGCFRDVYNQWRRGENNSGGAGREVEVLEQIETLFQEFTKQLFNVHHRYSDQSRSFMDRGRLSRDQKLMEFKTQLIYLFSTFKGGFPEWFQEFWMKLDPEILIQEEGNNPKKLWASYLERTKTLDGDYAEDLYNETLSRLYLESLRTKKAAGR